jgi:hypothetical protein
MKLQIGEVSGTLTVSDTTPLLRADEHQVSGLISRNQIENLPLNGRDFLELAKLEPGVTTPARFLFRTPTRKRGNNRVNNDDWFKGYGPLDRDVPHILNASAIFDLPWKSQVAVNSTYYSMPPFTAFVTGLDFNGDGTDGDALPGTNVNRFNRGLAVPDLVRAVDRFNQNFAGQRTPHNQPIPRISLPADYEFGDTYLTQDLRLSHTFVYREKYRLTLIGEVFNVFNIANLSGFSGDLANSATFGQPTRRVDQVFGSGGPRAFQFGARISF